MADIQDRIASAFEECPVVEHTAPGMVRVISFTDVYRVDVRSEVCECPDFQYHLDGHGRCKHVIAALVATEQLEIDLPGPELLADIDDHDADPIPAEATRSRP